jgi:hypothetical protein
VVSVHRQGSDTIGRWKLQLPNTLAVRSAFRPRSDGRFRITYIILAITYRGDAALAGLIRLSYS